MRLQMMLMRKEMEDELRSRGKFVLGCDWTVILRHKGVIQAFELFTYLCIYYVHTFPISKLIQRRRRPTGQLLPTALPR